MKKYTHAWLAFMAIKRLEDAGSSNKLVNAECKCTKNIIDFFNGHRDDVISGAWYPDSLIKDNANSHVMKYNPCDKFVQNLKNLPAEYLYCKVRKDSPVINKGFMRVDKKDNLPDRCESIAESIVDHFKIQFGEEKGSPVSPSDNQVALWLFMLSHYIADAHVPFHCDYRQFSTGENIHGRIEGKWESEIEYYYKIDEENKRFFYNEHYYPLIDSNKLQEFQKSYLKSIEEELSKREFSKSFGKNNNNVWDFIDAICQYSYLLSYCFLPPECNPENVTWDGLQSNEKYKINFEQLSVTVLTDTIDSISRVLFRVWRRCEKWKRKEGNKKENSINN